MHSTMPFLLWVGAVAMAPTPIDPQRLEAELAADADVMRSLNENGDVPTVVRPVDVRFIGSARTVGVPGRSARPNDRPHKG